MPATGFDVVARDSLGAVPPSDGGIVRIDLWGLKLHPVTLAQTLTAVEHLVRDGQPGYVITANLNYAMLSASDKRLRQVNDQASLLLADGMPLVWASRWKKRRLPERVAGADLIPALCELAALKGLRMFFFGGGPGVAEQAAENLSARFPGLNVVGIEAPDLESLSSEQEAELLARIRIRRADVFLAALGQPKGELWLARHYQAIGAPVSIQIGASLDFAAGRIPRAPRWVQAMGLEWAYRLSREPRRLAGRYWSNGVFLVRVILSDVFRAKNVERP